ncbi:MAG: hypothetical protein MN733_05975, partial [Nitrososphaera sp.]|nr:hypothetical protein [Nitrososphaera sp.]
PLTDLEQGKLFFWMSQNCSLHDADKLRKELPEIGFNIFGPPMTHGIPQQLFGHLQALCRGNRVIKAIKELRAHMGWSLKDAKDFIDRNCK